MNPITRFLMPFINTFFNKFTGVHFFGNMIIVWSLKWFMDPLSAFTVTFLIAITWEIYEYITEGIKPYGTADAWLKDTTNDLLVCLMVCGAILI